MCKLGEVFYALESMVYKIFFDLPLDKKTGTKGKGRKRVRCCYETARHTSTIPGVGAVTSNDS
jgi:hypothetical protein